MYPFHFHFGPTRNYHRKEWNVFSGGSYPPAPSPSPASLPSPPSASGEGLLRAEAALQCLHGRRQPREELRRAAREEGLSDPAHARESERRTPGDGRIPFFSTMVCQKPAVCPGVWVAFLFNHGSISKTGSFLGGLLERRDAWKEWGRYP